jgi:soluble lytic murein transglycosylase
MTRLIFVSFVVFLHMPLATFAFDNSLLRSQFKQAEKNIWRADEEIYQTLYQELVDYPLQPYLDQKRLINQMKLSLAPEIASFLSKYRGSPLDWPLRRKWLSYLIKKNKPVLFQQFYRPSNNVEFTCRYYQYQLDKGVDEQEVLTKVTPLWLVGKSQPKVCDPLFKRWQQAGFQTPDIVWQRIAKAADGGQHTLIPYLSTLLPDADQYLARLWHKVRKDPSYILRLSRFPTKSVKEAQIYAYGIKRYIWRDQNRALQSYQKAERVFDFSTETQQQIALKFALALASKNHYAAHYWLEKVEEKRLTSHIVQWRIANLLQNSNWQTIKSELLSLPKKTHESLQWQYWYARSLMATNEQQLGTLAMTTVAKKRHYYGFLAASLLELPIALEDRPLSITAAEKKAALTHVAGQRAFELFHIKRYHQARLEWNYWLSTLDKRQKLVAATLANQIGWYDRAIFALSQEGYLDDVDLRFPMGFDQQIKQHASKYSISPAWAFAVTRRESSFMSDANSPAGARGLMQVMPNTAKQLMRKKDLPKSYLFNSANNINLGTMYLRRLLDKHQGNQILATAAYNAGPYRVKKWVEGEKAIPADVWIENIPFKETRNYVKSVLAYQQIYHLKSGKKSNLFEQLNNMTITSP